MPIPSIQWSSGTSWTLNARGWDHVRPVTAALLVLVPCAIGLARHLRLLELGDDAARCLGARVELVRGGLLLTGVALAAVGTAIEVLDLLADLDETEERAIVAQGAPGEVVSRELVADVFDLDAHIVDDPITGTPLVIPVPARHRKAPTGLLGVSKVSMA